MKRLIVQILPFTIAMWAAIVFVQYCFTEIYGQMWPEFEQITKIIFIEMSQYIMIWLFFACNLLVFIVVLMNYLMYFITQIIDDVYDTWYVQWYQMKSKQNK